MDYPTPTSTTRQQDRAGLRRRANTVMLGMFGRAISRPHRRLVARAYANGAYRLSQGKPHPAVTRYSHFRGQPVVLNEAMLAWVAFGDRPTPTPEATNEE